MVGLTRRELVHPAGLPPTNSPFEAEDDNNFTTDAEMVGRLGFAPSSRRLRAGTSLSKFATLLAVCKDRDTKAELNHRSQICEVLTGTGISHRGKRESQAHRIGHPAITSTVRGLCRRNRFTWEMDGHEGSAPSIPVWKTGVCLSTPMPGKMESRARIALAYVVLQTTAWAVRPTGCEIKVRTETFASARID